MPRPEPATLDHTKAGPRLAPARPAALLPLGAVVAALALSACHERTGQPLDALRVIGALGQGPGQFLYPRAITADASTIFVVDKFARIQRLDPATGRMLRGWCTPVSVNGRPTGLTVAPDADGSAVLYVADTHQHRVLVYQIEPIDDIKAVPLARFDDPAPSIVLTWGEFGLGPGQFIYPCDVAVLPDPQGKAERIYVSEFGGNDRISVFDRRGTFISSFGTQGNDTSPGAPVQFSRPQAIAIEPRTRSLIVCDSGNHRVGVFTLDGSLVRWITGGAVGPEPARAAADQPRAPTEQTDMTDMDRALAADASALADRDPRSFLYPHGLEVLGDGTFLVVEFGGERLQHIDAATGRTIQVLGRSGRALGELRSPWSAAVVGDELFVLDSGNDRVQVIARPVPRLSRLDGPPHPAPSAAPGSIGVGSHLPSLRAHSSSNQVLPQPGPYFGPACANNEHASAEPVGRPTSPLVGHNPS